MRTSVSLYHRHRFPTEIISHCIGLGFRFALSFRDVEEMLTMRGVSLSYETFESGALSSVRRMPTASANRFRNRNCTTSVGPLTHATLGDRNPIAIPVP
jgi:putative transposase